MSSRDMFTSRGRESGPQNTTMQRLAYKAMFDFYNKNKKRFTMAYCDSTGKYMTIDEAVLFSIPKEKGSHLHDNYGMYFINDKFGLIKPYSKNGSTVFFDVDDSDVNRVLEHLTGIICEN
jgi:hypothetical protein